MKLVKEIYFETEFTNEDDELTNESLEDTEHISPSIILLKMRVCNTEDTKMS